jgi:hypothetical protein
MTSKRRHALEELANADRDVDPAATASKRQRGARGLAGDTVVNSAEFFAVPNAAPSGNGTRPGTPGPEAAFQVHFQSLQVFITLDDDVEKKAWELLKTTVRAADLGQLKPAAVCVSMIWLAARVLFLEAQTAPRHPLFEILSSMCAINTAAKWVSWTASLEEEG